MIAGQVPDRSPMTVKVMKEVKKTRVSTSRWMSPCRLLSSNSSLRKGDTPIQSASNDRQHVAQNPADDAQRQRLTEKLQPDVPLSAHRAP